MDGPLVFSGRLVALREGASGRTGRVSVRGATVEVALDLVPEAREGDGVLVHAGVALSVLRDEAVVPAGGRDDSEAGGDQGA
ncbi:MAG: HypC/HybG/HupF family hydrogenase formation chaperone [Betaproteobacteria bacterium]